MFELLILIPGVVILLSMIVAYRRFHDPLHPIMYIGPMLVYLHVMIPAALLYRGLIGEVFPNADALIFAQFIVALEIIAFCVGCLTPRTPPGALRNQGSNLQFSDRVLGRMRILSYALGGTGLLAYVYRLSTVGGFVTAYSKAKGGSAAAGVSGYITGGSLLTIPAIILLVLSQRGKKLDFKTAALMLLFVMPHLLQGLFAGSRGNAFLALTTVLVSWYLVKAKRPRLRSVFAVLGVMAVLMFFLKTHRREIYLGSGSTQIDTDKVVEAILPVELEPSHTTPLTWGVIIASRHNSRFYWGRRYAAQLFVRPIPRQIWPTKYADMGLGWMVNQPGSAGMHPHEWIDALGWFPAAGSAVGIIGDAFLELSWGGILVCFLMGLFYGTLWKNAVVLHGLWMAIYCEACVVSVYLPTQGLATAWLYRFMYLAVPTAVIWFMFFTKKRVPGPPQKPKPRKIINFVVQAMHRDKQRRSPA